MDDADRTERYSDRMRVLRPYLKETLLALLVLALVCLSFAHRPLTAAPILGDKLAGIVDASYCGDLPADDAGHAPCHACRLGEGLALAPPCPTPIPATDAGLAVEPVVVVDVALAAPVPAIGARGPPTA